MLISIEGMDGSGKTTLAKLVAERTNIPYITSTTQRFFNMNDQVSREMTHKIYDDYSAKIQALYYLFGYASVYEESLNKDLILDRGFLSTYYFSYNDETKPIFDLAFSSFGVPNIIFLLYASLDERVRRIKMRNPNDKDLKKERLYVDGYAKYFEGIKEYNMPYVLISTENLNSAEAANVVIKLLDFYRHRSEMFFELMKIFSIENIPFLQKKNYNDINNILEEKRLEYKI